MATTTTHTLKKSSLYKLRSSCKPPFKLSPWINQKHSFHLVDPSPWPFLMAFSLLSLVFGLVLYFNGYLEGGSPYFGMLWRFGVCLSLFILFCWCRDIIREGTFEGQHTLSVQKGLRLGMALFIISEVMFFFAFFFAFFYCSLNPSHNIGGVWPPFGLSILDPWGFPLINTLCLLTSGITVTATHYAICGGSKSHAFFTLVWTILLALLFTCTQVFEYIIAPFTINDGIYGSTFYLTTGFHGFHVLIGTIFLAVCLLRLHLDHFTIEHHFGFEAAVWYWHFVDIVWLFLFLTVYCWGS